MKKLHELIRFFSTPVALHFADEGAAGGASGGAGGPQGSAGADPAKAEGGQAAAGASADAGAKGQAAAGAAAANAGFGSFLQSDGTFKPGWSKALGLEQGADGSPNPIEKKFSSPEALAKSYAALEKMNGSSNKVAIPGKDAKPEEIAAYRQKMGIPEKPELYGMDKMPEKLGDKPFPKELWDASTATEAAALFHKLGLTKEQAAGLLEWNFTKAQGGLEAMNQQAQTQLTLATDALKKEWGVKFSENLAAANKAAAEMGWDGTKPENAALANNPDFIRAMAKVASIIKEPTGDGNRSATQAVDPQARITELRTMMTKPGYRNSPDYKNHAQHVAELTALTKQKHGEA